MIRDDLRHLKWRLMTQQGFSEKEASSRIHQVKMAERRDAVFNNSLKKKKENGESNRHGNIKPRENGTKVN